MGDCIFCKIIKKQIPADIIYENKDVLVFQSLENHPLVITKKHIKDIYELDDDLGSEIMKAAIKISKATKKGLQAEGINLVQSNEKAAHQDVFHFHLHIKPRWKNDNVKLHWETEGFSEDLRKSTAENIKINLI